MGIAQLNSVKDGLNNDQRVSLYHAFIGCHLDYCGTVWSSAGKTLLNCLSVKQRDAVRAILNYRTKVNEAVMTDMRITPLVEHWRRREAVWLYKIRNSVSAIPQYVKDLIPFRDLTEVKRLRRPVSIDFASRTNIGKETLAFRLRELFSKLEDLIKSSWSLFTFRMNLRSICLSE